MDWTLLLFLIGVLFIAAWAYYALRAHNAVRKGEEQIMTMVYKGQETQDLMKDVHVPDVFDEALMASHLARLASSPTLIGKYLDQAAIRFTQSQEIKILEKWTQLYRAGQAVIDARADMARSYSGYQQVNTEAVISTKQKDVSLANLDADHAEARLRQEHAKKALKDLKETKPLPAPAAPALTAEQERILKKNEIETAIERLKQECKNKMDASTDENERIRTQNMYDDAIARKQEELRRYL